MSGPHKGNNTHDNLLFWFFEIDCRELCRQLHETILPLYVGQSDDCSPTRYRTVCETVSKAKTVRFFDFKMIKCQISGFVQADGISGFGEGIIEDGFVFHECAQVEDVDDGELDDAGSHGFGMVFFIIGGAG